jgi:hypothetical protein
MPSKQTSLELLNGFPELEAVLVTPLRFTLPHDLRETLRLGDFLGVDACALAPGKTSASEPRAATPRRPPGRRNRERSMRRACVRSPDIAT